MFTILFMIFCIVLELAVYTNIRSQAIFFTKMKQIEMQQTQLKDLLELVPDSVYICTRSSDNSEPKGLFANCKMNNFFGQDVLLSGKGPTNSRKTKVRSKKKPEPL